MLSNRIFVVEVTEDRSTEFMGHLSEMQDAGLVVDWGSVVPVSLADDEVEEIGDAYDEAAELVAFDLAGNRRVAGEVEER